METGVGGGDRSSFKWAEAKGHGEKSPLKRSGPACNRRSVSETRDNPDAARKEEDILLQVRNPGWKMN